MTGQSSSLTLPVVTPPLPDIVELIEKRANLVVVRSLTHHREAAQQAVEGDETAHAVPDTPQHSSLALTEQSAGNSQIAVLDGLPSSASWRSTRYKDFSTN